MENQTSALDQRMAILRQAFGNEAMVAFRPMTIQEVVRVLRGTVSNAKGRAEKQALPFDHTAVAKMVEALVKLDGLPEIEHQVASIVDACDAIPKQEAGVALLPLTEAELAELASIHEAIGAHANATGIPMATVCSLVRRALLTWRQVPKQEGQEGQEPEGNEPEEGS